MVAHIRSTFNGSTNYAKPIPFDVGSNGVKENLNLSLAPNPNNGIFNLVIGKHAGYLKLKITVITGQVLFETIVPAGKELIAISLESISSGCIL